MKTYFGEGNKPMKTNELINLFKSHSIVTFTLPGVGETTIETSLFHEVVKEIENNIKTAKVIEFHEPTYYIGCGNCEAEVVGKYCSECGAKLIYESEGE